MASTSTATAGKLCAVMAPRGLRSARGVGSLSRCGVLISGFGFRTGTLAQLLIGINGYSGQYALTLEEVAMLAEERMKHASRSST
jgi:hypothetical protein